MEKSKAIELITKEYVFQEEESLLETPEKIFAAFEQKFNNIINVIQFAPLKKYLLKKGFDYLQKNNYSAVEIRTVEGLSPTIDKELKEMSTEQSIDFLKKIVVDWTKSRKSEMKINFIITGVKGLPETVNIGALNYYKQACKKYPKLFVGFDMVSYEDTASLNEYCKYVTPYLDKEMKHKYNAVYHAGESYKRMNKNCKIALENYTLRLGHGLNLLRDPESIQEVVNKNILVEANPLSNLLLGYVGDLNWHPIKFLKEFKVKIR